MLMKRGMLVLFFILLSLIPIVSALTINVPGNYSGIQDAINNASNGDIINVSGNYNENIVVNKEVEIIGVNAVVNGGGDAAFEIRADNVKISGFNISTNTTFAGGALEIYSSDNVEISGNNIETASKVIGIWVCGSNSGCSRVSNLDIINNNIKINGVSTGIYADFSSPAHTSWLIQGNKIDSAGVNLELYDVKNADVNNNTFYGNGNSVSVVYASEFSNISNADFLDNLFLGNGDLNSWGVTPSFWIESDFNSGDGNTGVDDLLIQGNEFYNWVNSGVKIGEPSVGYNKISNVVVNYNGFNSGSGAAIDNYVKNIIVDGRFNWWGACDGPGPVASGSGKGVSVNVTYTPWLGACINNKTGPSCSIESKNVTLYANITGFCVDNVKFGVNINGTWQNYSGIPTIVPGLGNYYFTIPSLLLIPGNVSWTVYADDCYNHTSKNGIKTFYVKKKTSLTTNPANPDGLNGWYVTEPLFTLTNPDASKIWYEWDSTGNILYTAPFNLTNIPNPLPVSAGILELAWFSDVCANESEQSKIFKIDLTNPVIKDLSPANGSTVINNNKPEISAYIDEIWQSNSGINLSHVIMKVDNASVNANVSTVDSLDALVIYKFTNSSPLSDGLHTAFVSAKDNSGRYSEIKWQFSTNSSAAFSLNVISPVNKTYGSKRINFNLNISNEVQEISYIDYTDRIPRWKKLCSGCSSYNKTKSLRDGMHNISFEATDYYGASDEKDIVFLVDSIKPRILNTEPRSSSYANGEEFLIKYTEENLAGIVLYYSNGIINQSKVLTNCTAGEYQICITNANLSMFEGQKINYWFAVSDTIRSVNSTKKKITVDTIVPVMNVLSPQNGGSYGNNVPFKINVSENAELRYSEDNINFKLLCRSCLSYDKYKIFGDGVYNITIKAEDKAGNSAEFPVGFSVA